MTKPKEVAKSLKEILVNNDMKIILDKSSNIEPIIEKVIDWWSYDLYSRRPGPAYTDDNVFQGTDLDMAAFLYALSDRGAAINIPSYDRMRKSRLKEGQIIISKENRHGEIVGLTANKETFTFSVKIKDMNVMKSNGFGDFRNFSLTDMDGSWYEGWKQIQFIPSEKEDNFLNEFRVKANHNTVMFKNFIHPNRWISFFGQYYFITKALINRLDEESKDLNIQIKRMLENGINYPPISEEAQSKPASIPQENGKRINVKAFEVEIDVPNNSTKFPVYSDSQENLILITRKRKDYVYKIIPKLRFATRATEYAYYSNGEGKFPTWLENVKWEADYIQKGKRKKWDRLVLFQPSVGEIGVSIRKRVYDKVEVVSENY